MSDEKPPEKPTTQLPAVPDWAIELTKSVRLGFGDVQKRLDEQDVKLDNQDAKLDKVVTEGIESNTRLTRIEVRVDGVERHVGDLESRVGRASNRVREVSQSDLDQSAQLAQERAAREALAADAAAVKKDVTELKQSQELQLAILTRLDKIAANPNLKIILAVLATAATAWLANKGLK